MNWREFKALFKVSAPIQPPGSSESIDSKVELLIAQSRARYTVPVDQDVMKKSEPSHKEKTAENNETIHDPPKEVAYTLIQGPSPPPPELIERLSRL